MCPATSAVPVNEGCHRDDDSGDDVPFLKSRWQPDVAVGVKFFMVLSYTQVLGLCLAGFALGALIPYVCWDSQHTFSQSPPILSSGSDSKLFNNLRYSSPTTRTADEKLNPKIAWLMAFPNSGTTYTIELIAAASNMSMATNYGNEQETHLLHKHYPNLNTSVLPVFTRGPFWTKPLQEHPKSVVLTKTHCGGYCHDCAPSAFTETPHSFLMHCASAKEGTDSIVDGVEVPTIRYIYDYNEVDRAIHLIRDPLDNMVARFHYDATQLVRAHPDRWADRYTYDAKGFANLCADGSLSYAEHKDTRIDAQVLELIEDIPCHLDLFRYVQWHNLAFVATDNSLQIPTLVVNYEDYSSDFEGTLQSMLDFLELPNTGNYEPFVKGKSYRDYFTDDQIARMRQATMMMSLPVTWHHLERYF